MGDNLPVVRTEADIERAIMAHVPEIDRKLSTRNFNEQMHAFLDLSEIFDELPVSEACRLLGRVIRECPACNYTFDPDEPLVKRMTAWFKDIGFLEKYRELINSGKAASSDGISIVVLDESNTPMDHATMAQMLTFIKWREGKISDEDFKALNIDGMSSAGSFKRVRFFLALKSQNTMEAIGDKEFYDNIMLEALRWGNVAPSWDQMREPVWAREMVGFHGNYIRAFGLEKSWLEEFKSNVEKIWQYACFTRQSDATSFDPKAQLCCAQVMFALIDGPVDELLATGVLPTAFKALETLGEQRLNCGMIPDGFHNWVGSYCNQRILQEAKKERFGGLKSGALPAADSQGAAGPRLDALP